MSTTPSVGVAPPPPGVTPNFINAESEADAVIVTISVTTALMVVFVCLRMYTNIAITRSVWWDDYACILSAAGAVAYMGLVMSTFSSHILGKHLWNIPITAFLDINVGVDLFKKLNESEAIYGPIMFCTKLGLLLLYLRIFAPNRTLRFLIYFGIAFNAVLYSIHLLLLLLICPGEDVLMDACQTEVSIISVSVSAVSAASDIYTLLIPLLGVSRLHMSRKKKLGIGAVFFSGSLACVAGILSFGYRVRLITSPDTTWDATPPLILSVLELDIGVFVSCMPALSALFRTLEWKSSRLYSIPASVSRIFKSEKSLRKPYRASQPMTEAGSSPHSHDQSGIRSIPHSDTSRHSFVPTIHGDSFFQLGNGSDDSEEEHTLEEDRGVV